MSPLFNFDRNRRSESLRLQISPFLAGEFRGRKSMNGAA